MYRFAARNVLRIDHLVHVRRTEIRARIAELFRASRTADIGVVDDEMRRLIFFVLRTGVIEIGKFIEGEFSIAAGGAENRFASIAVSHHLP